MSSGCLDGGGGVRLDHAVFPVFATEEYGQAIALRVVKHHEGALAEFQVHDGFVREQGLDAEVFLVDDHGFDVFIFSRMQ